MKRRIVLLYNNRLFSGRHMERYDFSNGVTLMKHILRITVMIVILFAGGTSFGQSTTHSALLVIDMQKDLLTPGRAGMKMDSPEIAVFIDNVNDCIRRADSMNIPVLYIQNLLNPLFSFFSGNVCRRGDPETGLDPRLAVVDSLVFEKSMPSSMSNRQLVRFLGERNITTLFICGIKAPACVKATALDAIRQGFTVRLVSDAVASNTPGQTGSVISLLAKKGVLQVDTLDYGEARWSTP